MAAELYPSGFPANNCFFPEKCSAFSVMHLTIISSNFYSAARRGGPYFLDEKKVCKDSRGLWPLDPRGCPASPSPLTFSSALGRLAPLGSLNAGPLQEHSQSYDCESSSAFLGVRHAGSKWATAVACGGSAVSPRKNGSCAKRNWRDATRKIMLCRVTFSALLNFYQYKISSPA